MHISYRKEVTNSGGCHLKGECIAYRILILYFNVKTMFQAKSLGKSWDMNGDDKLKE